MLLQPAPLGPPQDKTPHLLSSSNYSSQSSPFLALVRVGRKPDSRSALKRRPKGLRRFLFDSNGSPIAVYPSHALKWAFRQEKATFHNAGQCMSIGQPVETSHLTKQAGLGFRIAADGGRLLPAQVLPRLLEPQAGDQRDHGGEAAGSEPFLRAKSSPEVPSFGESEENWKPDEAGQAIQGTV